MAGGCFPGMGAIFATVGMTIRYKSEVDLFLTVRRVRMPSIPVMVLIFSCDRFEITRSPCFLSANIDSLRDKKMQAAVDTRLARVRAGNFGDCKFVGGGVLELRIALGPGLRIYYGLHGRQVVILLGGGDKRSQSRDIRRAQQLWQQFTKHASEKLSR